MTHALIQVIEQKCGSLEGFLDCLLFRVRRNYMQRMRDYISIILEQKNQFSTIPFINFNMLIFVPLSSHVFPWLQIQKHLKIGFVELSLMIISVLRYSAMVGTFGY